MPLKHRQQAFVRFFNDGGVMFDALRNEGILPRAALYNQADGPKCHESNPYFTEKETPVYDSTW